MVGYQINVHDQNQDAKGYGDPVKDDQATSRYEAYVFVKCQTTSILTQNVKCIYA